MLFSSPLFLFLFLPIVLAIYIVLLKLRLRNGWLLLASLVFYAWGAPGFILILLASTLVNFTLGRWLENTEDGRRRKQIVSLAIIANLGLLAYFKYAGFSVATLNESLKLLGLHPLPIPQIALPIGISFFTFHALSYVIDVYRRKWPAARDPRDVALYIFFFPQMIAGPILRWNAIAPQLEHRQSGSEVFAEGVRRFAVGLAKKMIIANTVALPADQIFALPANQLSAGVAWLGIVCYTLQIYFDFSGYSDMAIGLGKMFGFEFIENFQFPYTAQSLRDFWRRWHISLSTWFRDYVYIPLGGNRVSAARTHLNLLAVFFLCGLWHGANWTFVTWGLYHGLFLLLERTAWGALLDKLPQLLRHVYAMVVVMLGWVLFRADTFPEAAGYFSALFGLGHAVYPEPMGLYATPVALDAVALGIFFSGFQWNLFKSACARHTAGFPVAIQSVLAGLGHLAEITLVLALLVVSAIWMADGTYNPFIYFHF